MPTSSRPRVAPTGSPRARRPRPTTSRAKLFRNGGSQAVRLPKECRFEGVTEVLVHREGRRVILEPPDEWSEEFLACLGAWKSDIPRIKQQPLADLKNPFED